LAGAASEAPNWEGESFECGTEEAKGVWEAVRTIYEYWLVGKRDWGGKKGCDRTGNSENAEPQKDF